MPVPGELSPEDALLEIVRGRLEGLGPVETTALASSLGLNSEPVESALARLEAEGFAMRGRFSADATGEEWCERRLLSRIHRYTIRRLRAEIEPVAVRDFLRFLFAWQRVTPEARMAGPKAMDTVLAQLEGFNAPAAVWETEILPARIGDYDPDWLDERCLAGRFTWLRLRPHTRTNGEGRVAPVRTTPVAILPRRHCGLWMSLLPAINGPHPSSQALRVLECIQRNGASFFHDLLENSGLLKSQLKEAIAELVALGLVTSDSFGGLRALLVRSSRRRAHGRRHRNTDLFRMEDAGRWSLVRRNADAIKGDAIEHVARTLLRRYGVVFRRLIERETAWLPPWRDLLRAYRRLESRGEIRGGRFVGGFSGEQFALPEAVGLLRTIRRTPKTGELVSISAADPLNLVGILTPGSRVSSLPSNRILFRDGEPIAILEGGRTTLLVELGPSAEWEARNALIRRRVPPQLREYLGQLA